MPSSPSSAPPAAASAAQDGIEALLRNQGIPDCCSVVACLQALSLLLGMAFQFADGGGFCGEAHINCSAELQVYQQSIALVCIQDWPGERILVQVLDDSNDLDVQVLIPSKRAEMETKGCAPIV
ncbi:putative xyloglucan glycosyltransferase 6 [Camellia lanceoleosa]|uniref:Xyloglucan glycosyltransferase 6 n=1 Tax=Camellia lanceoleosa TaxID=1840588 RepID=A0ACC0F761_9ERIC|nr:putative xyloglucan glycosyltransferase 6 [Camellia lanceoleosa]